MSGYEIQIFVWLRNEKTW